MTNSSQFRAGEWVRVRSRDQILKTLDGRGQLDGLPFMPEMLQFCGRPFKVFKRAHKTCDPPNGLDGRRMREAVHLEGLRCHGDAHGGCQAGCLLFWKDAWLEPVNGSGAGRTAEGVGCTEADVLAGTRAPGDLDDDPTYVCQSTQIPAATEPLRWWDFRQYREDYTSRNVPLGDMLSSLSFFLYDSLATAGLGLGSPLRASYDFIQKRRGRTPYPRRTGAIPAGTQTPSATLNLQAGELVRIKTYEEVLETINEEGLNRGMWFDAEMVPFCGGTYRVLARVNTIINEKTGKMQRLKNDCIALEDVVCKACYAKYRRFCPRSIYAYWREIWLERVSLNPNSKPL